VGPKSLVAKEIEERGGIVTGWYSEGYLVVGKYADPRWIHGIYGRKVEYALENKIPIISEEYLVEAFGRIPKLPPKPPKPPKKKEPAEPLKPEQWSDLVKRAEDLRNSGEISGEVCNEILAMISRYSGLTDIKFEETQDDSIQIKALNDEKGVGLSITINNASLEKKRAEWQKFLNPQSATNPQ